ncbi:MAG: LapA family protein [Pseudomonadota bacterium]
MKPKLIVIGLLMAIVVVFAIQNRQIVTVWFLFWEITGSRAAILLLIFTVGFFTGWLAGFRRRKKQ